jgi:hypothetical protein
VWVVGWAGVGVRQVRRRVWVVGVVVAALVVGGGVGVLLWLRSGRVNPRVSAIERGVTALPVSSPAAASTVQEFGVTDPLGRFVVVADALVGAHSVSQCAAAAASLARLGTPTYIRGLAAEVPDGVAGDVAGGVVSATVSVLSSCSARGEPSSQELLALRVETAGLSARLRVDRR